MILSGKYEVTEKVGQGGMGIVYRVRHLDLDTVLALKILPRELSQDPDLVERFRREARMMARLNHANIVHVFDFAKDGNTYYLIMEFLSGRNLRQILQERLERTRMPLPLPEVLRVGVQIAEALAYAHGQRPAVVHRDIKPSNIIIEEGTQRAVVTDFGIAKLMGESQSELTHTGLFVGTVKYCAPEQLRHDADIDARVDLYALGMLLYELYTGKQFFAGLKDHEVIGKVLYEQGENTIDLPDTPPEFSALLARAIARDRDARHPSAQALLADLQACLRGVEPDTSVTAGGAEEIEAQIRALERVRLQRLAEEARDVCQTARDAAERNGAAVNGGGAFTTALGTQEDGLALLGRGEHEAAAAKLREAASAFGEAASVASRQRAERSVAQAREAAEDLQRQAHESGAAETAAARLARADAIVQTAGDLAQAGDYERATAEFGEAAEAYGALVADAQRAQELRALEASLPDIRAARTRAEAADAPALVPAAFSAAVRDQQRFEEALAAEQLTAAQELVVLVRSAFDAATEGAEAAHLQEAARQAREAMEARRAAAETAAGDREPAADMARAAARASAAADAERQDDWPAARTAYEEAASLYGECEQQALVRAEEAQAQAVLVETRATCDEARSRAADGGASKGAPTLFGRARDLGKKAVRQEKSGEAAKATTTYRQAAEQYAQALQVAERRAQRKALEQARAAIVDARAGAEEAGGKETASFAEAESARAEVERALEADDLTAGACAAEVARQAYGAARADAERTRRLTEADAVLTEAAAVASKIRQSDASAAARAEADRVQQAAVAAGAPEYMAADFESAARELRDGDAAVAEEDFAAAEAAFLSATAAFRVVVAASERVRAEREAQALRDQARALRVVRDPERESRGARRKIKRADRALARGERLLGTGGDLAKAHAEFARAVRALEALSSPAETEEDVTSMATVIRPALSVARPSIPWLSIGGVLAAALIVTAWLALRPAATPDTLAPGRVAQTGGSAATEFDAAPVDTEPAAADAGAGAAEEVEGERASAASEPVRVAAVEREVATPVPVQTPPPAPVIRRVEPDEAAVKLQAGGDAAFRVEVADASDVSYEWQVGGEVVSGAQGATLTVPVPDEPSAVVVVARNAGGSVEHRWDLAALPRATVAPPPRKPPEIVTAAPRGRSLSVDVGKHQRFSVQVASADDRLTYAWSVDGRDVGRDRSFALVPKDADEGATRKVRVRVEDTKGKAAMREWTVDVPKLPVSIVGQRPASDASYEIGTSAALSVEARVGSRRDVPLEYRWSVDGRRVADARGPSLRHEIARPQTQVEVVVEAPGRQAAVRRWRLRGEHPPEPEPTVNLEGEIRAWIEAYRSAYEQKNVDRLVSLGVLRSGNRDRMRRVLDDLDDLQVRIAKRSIDVKAPDRAIVSLTRVDSFSAGRGREEKSIPISKTLRKRNGLWVAE